MSIIFGEIKKIWSIKMVVIVTVICTLFYVLFMHFHIKHFPNGHPFTELYDFSSELTEKYGPTLEKNEFESFMNTHEMLIAEADTYIKNDPIFARVGVYSYEDYINLHKKSDFTQAENNAIWQLLGKENDFIEFKIQAFDSIKESYNGAPAVYEHSISDLDSSIEKKRLREILESEQYLSIMHYQVIENTFAYITLFGILAVLSIVVFISPLLVSDTMSGVYLLQYTSKRGRKVLQSQLIATLISAFLLLSLETTIATMIYSLNGTHVFWNNGMNSFLGFFDFWFDVNFGQYVIFNAAMVYIISMGAALFAFVLSKLSRNYISLILKLIPMFVAMVFLCNKIFDSSFTMQNSLYRMTGIIAIEPIACCIVLLAGVLLYLLISRRESKIGIL